MVNRQDFIFQPFTVKNVCFRNPFYVASGPTTRNIRQLIKAEECGWGGASIKLTIAPEPYINREPRYGWFENQHIFAFTAEKRLKPDEGLRLVEQARQQTSEFVILANITYAGEKSVTEGWGTLAKQFESAGAHIIELNMCCPNMSYNLELSHRDKVDSPKTGASLGQDAEAVSHITRVVKESVGIPVFVKLTPEGGRVAEVAKACIEAGADGVGGTANRLAIPPFDIYHPDKAPYHLQDELSLSCFSGEWVKPLALRDVYEIRKKLGPEAVIVGTGGIRNYKDVVEMALMGANLFQICTETIISGYGFLGDIIRDLQNYFREKDYDSFENLRGTVVDKLKSAQTVTLHRGFARIKDETLTAPCVVACPNYVPAQGYVMAVSRREFRKAYDLITTSGPFQTVCGYACHHPCESACVRGDVDEPISIKEIKRFVLEYGRDQGWSPKTTLATSNNIKVAVIGAGPAGLSAAYYLTLAGYGVTVFEKENQAGGLLRYGIPRFRLPEDIVNYEIQMLTSLGINIRTNQKFPENINLAKLKQQGYRAIILAVGAGKSIPLNVPVESTVGYFSALQFLKDFSKGRVLQIGKRVVVIGGGFSAIDAARTAIRLGTEEVYLAYRRTKEEMPVNLEEINQAEEEGVKIMYLVSPKSLHIEEGKVIGVRFVNYILGKKDSSNRRSPLEVEGTEFTLKVDTVIAALGQQIESDLDESLEQIRRNGKIQYDSVTGKTPIDNIFVAGDAAEGASDIISAVASGRIAAIAIDKNLAGEQATLESRIQLNQADRLYLLEQKGNTRRIPAVRKYIEDSQKRITHFNNYTRTLTEDEAVSEANRCLNCGCGEGCLLCVDICNSFAISSVRNRPEINDSECVGCGVCVWRCPNKNIEMIRLT